MTWINVIQPQQATGKLKKLYQRISGPNGKVDNILKAHSLRPSSLEGHMALYKNVLHHQSNQLPKWQLETLGCYVSMCNRCDYCVAHHAAGLSRLLADANKFEIIMQALENKSWHQNLDPQTASLLDYAHKLTQAPQSLAASDLDPMRQAGLDDGGILEANQVIAYFAYANRTVLGLGVQTTGDVLGLSPSGSEEDSWSHQ